MKEEASPRTADAAATVCVTHTEKEVLTCCTLCYMISKSENTQNNKARSVYFSNLVVITAYCQHIVSMVGSDKNSVSSVMPQTLTVALFCAF